MLKKFLSEVLSLTIAFILFACGGSQTIQSIESISHTNGGAKISNTNTGADLKTKIENAITVDEINEKYQKDKNDEFIKEPFYHNKELSTVYIGSFPQSDSTGNIKEPLEWYVLKKENNRALLLLKNSLPDTYKKFNDEMKNVSWENCTLRDWLNNNFYNYAFSNNDKSSILESLVENDSEVYGNLNGGNVKDKVFILSLDEAKKYLVDESIRKAETYWTRTICYSNNKIVTKWYNSNGDEIKMPAGAIDEKKLKEQGIHSEKVDTGELVTKVAVYDSSSDRFYINNGYEVNDEYISVRPAMWVKY